MATRLIWTQPRKQADPSARLWPDEWQQKQWIHFGYKGCQALLDYHLITCHLGRRHCRANPLNYKILVNHYEVLFCFQDYQETELTSLTKVVDPGRMWTSLGEVSKGSVTHQVVHGEMRWYTRWWWVKWWRKWSPGLCCLWMRPRCAAVVPVTTLGGVGVSGTGGDSRFCEEAHEESCGSGTFLSHAGWKGRPQKFVGDAKLYNSM